MTKKILHLTLKREWFDLIAIGRKTREYRANKPYWTKRLENPPDYRGVPMFKRFDEVHFKNGYRKDSPFMRIKFITTQYGYDDNEQECYVIFLGKILEFKNYKKPTEREIMIL